MDCYGGVYPLGKLLQSISALLSYLLKLIRSGEPPLPPPSALPPSESPHSRLSASASHAAICSQRDPQSIATVPKPGRWSFGQAQWPPVSEANVTGTFAFHCSRRTKNYHASPQDRVISEFQFAVEMKGATMSGTPHAGTLQSNDRSAGTTARVVTVRKRTSGSRLLKLSLRHWCRSRRVYICRRRPLPGVDPVGPVHQILIEHVGNAVAELGAHAARRWLSPSR